jgi:hypothetical protein
LGVERDLSFKPTALAIIRKFKWKMFIFKMKLKKVSKIELIKG